VAGSAGAVARTRWAATFPFGTLVINVTGSVLLGVLTGLVLLHGQPGAFDHDRGHRVLRRLHHLQHSELRDGPIKGQHRHRTAILNVTASVLLPVAGSALGLLVTSPEPSTRVTASRSASETLLLVRSSPKWLVHPFGRDAGWVLSSADERCRRPAALASA